MPTNVTPEYRKAEEAFRTAGSVDEKVERLEDMIALLPKHKGTEHLYADLKRRLSRLRKQQERSGGKSAGRPVMDLGHEGAAQIVLIGPANSGKSTILEALTHAHPDIGDYPFTTMQMQPGMIPYEDIQIELIDSPPVTADYMPPYLFGLVRSADAALLVTDLAADTLLDDTQAVLAAFSQRHVRFVREREPHDRDAILSRIVANKADADGADVRLALLREMLGDRLDIYPVSCTRPIEGQVGNVKEIPDMLFRWLKIIRVYTKAPGKKADLGRPFTVFEGQTVADVCVLVHRDFAEQLHFARLWRAGAEPITVSRNETVRDGDVVELHI